MRQRIQERMEDEDEAEDGDGDGDDIGLRYTDAGRYACASYEERSTWQNQVKFQYLRVSYES